MKILVKFQKKTHSIDLNMPEPKLIDLRNATLANLEINPVNFQIIFIFNASILKNDILPLRELGINERSVIYIMIKPNNLINILFYQRNKIEKFQVPIDLNSTINEIKQKLVKKIHFSIDQIILVHKGKILDDNFTLHYYSIHENDIIYLTVNLKKRDLESLISKLFDNIKKFIDSIFSPTKRYYMKEIRCLLMDPILIEESQTNPTIKKVINETNQMLKVFNSSFIETLNTSAFIKDMGFMKLESDPLSMIHFQNALKETEADENEEELLKCKFNLEKPETINETELPKCWHLFSSDINQYPTHNEHFNSNNNSCIFSEYYFTRIIQSEDNRLQALNRISILRKLGFNEDNVIVKVLNATA